MSKYIVLEVPDDWKDHHAIDYEWFKREAQEVVEVTTDEMETYDEVNNIATIQPSSYMRINGKPVKLYAAKDSN